MVARKGAGSPRGVRRVLKVLSIVVLVVVGLVVALLVVGSAMPTVAQDYYEHVETGGPVEARYTAMGPYQVGHQDFDAADDTIKKYEVWYPADLEGSDRAWPVVVVANGTGTPASKYQAVFEHLASWGFVVVGNEDPSSWSGESCERSLAFLLAQNEDAQSVFYQRIDGERVGLAGHSQGGVAVVNAATTQPHAMTYKAVFGASTTFQLLAQNLGWPYDASAIKAPYLMVAGTGASDAGDGKEDGNAGIAPLWSMHENYDAVGADVPKAMARLVGAEHGDMLSKADGYMTAWFCYWLQGDAEAGSAFLGDDAEILTNPRWQDVAVSLADPEGALED